MAPKKEYIFGGIGGIICISAIILAIVFGILWGQKRNKLDACLLVSGKCHLCNKCLDDANNIFKSCYNNALYSGSLNDQGRIDAYQTCSSEQLDSVSNCYKDPKGCKSFVT
jgi:hypothetical protein